MCSQTTTRLNLKGKRFKVATEKPATNFNRNLLSSFILPTKEFEDFILKRVSVVFLKNCVLKEIRNGFEIKFDYNQNIKVNVVEKIYRKLIKGGFNYTLVYRKNSSIGIIFCNKANYKQTLFNIRSKNVNSYKSCIKKESSKFMLEMVQLKKVNFSRNFILSVYSLEKDKYTTYKPFSSIKRTPKKKHLKVKLPEFEYE